MVSRRAFFFHSTFLHIGCFLILHWLKRSSPQPSLAQKIYTTMLSRIWVTKVVFRNQTSAWIFRVQNYYSYRLPSLANSKNLRKSPIWAFLLLLLPIFNNQLEFPRSEGFRSRITVGNFATTAAEKLLSYTYSRRKTRTGRMEVFN